MVLCAQDQGGEGTEAGDAAAGDEERGKKAGLLEAIRLPLVSVFPRSKLKPTKVTSPLRSLSVKLLSLLVCVSLKKGTAEFQCGRPGFESRTNCWDFTGTNTVMRHALWRISFFLNAYSS